MENVILGVYAVEMEELKLGDSIFIGGRLGKCSPDNCESVGTIALERNPETSIGTISKFMDDTSHAFQHLSIPRLPLPHFI